MANFWIGVAVGSIPCLLLSAWLAVQWRESYDELLDLSSSFRDQYFNEDEADAGGEETKCVGN